jgi:hypothetical protein
MPSLDAIGFPPDRTLFQSLEPVSLQDGVADKTDD